MALRELPNHTLFLALRRGRAISTFLVSCYSVSDSVRYVYSLKFTYKLLNYSTSSLSRLRPREVTTCMFFEDSVHGGTMFCLARASDKMDLVKLFKKITEFEPKMRALFSSARFDIN